MRKNTLHRIAGLVGLASFLVVLGMWPDTRPSVIKDARAQPIQDIAQFGGIPITASATGTTAATTATLAASTTLVTYICGFSIRANATAAATGTATVTGTITGTLSFVQWTAPLASGIGVVEPPFGSACIPGSGINTAIAVVSAAPGGGGTVSVSAWGFQYKS